jgi:transcriptional regulator with GAF, ATPase, and Fis domain
MREVYEEVAAVADSSALVLIQGETGTGKELIAHALHYRSGRSSAPLVAVNCGALPENLLESELFGHERGAFTGAVRQHQGKFEQADGGTLFLDEIGEIPPPVQVRLLRVLEGGMVTRVGGEHAIKVNVRVITATNRDLWKEVQAGAFRADLYYRLNVFAIRLPRLADRREDIPLLVEHFARKFAARHARPEPRWSIGAMRALQGHSWPGNVRELEHFIERMVLLSGGGEIASVRLPEAAEVPPPAGGPGLAVIGAGGLPAALEEYERALIADALREAGGVQARAARRLGISRSNLNYRIGRLGLTLQDIRFGVDDRAR